LASALALALALAFGTGASASALAVDKLLISFSRFHTFLILAGTSCLGLGLGWLTYWAFKAVTGH
jgi:serine/threonine-protein kinase